MKIKLRGKVWKQITFEEYYKLEGYKVAIFRDLFYNEDTYFKLVESECKVEKENGNEK